MYGPFPTVKMQNPSSLDNQSFCPLITGINENKTDIQDCLVKKQIF